MRMIDPSESDHYMPRESSKDRFLNALRAFGGSAGNARLSAALGWQEPTYWRVHASLVEEGVILKGRGRGGSVSLAASSFSPAEETFNPDAAKSQLRSTEIATMAVTASPSNIEAGQTASDARDVSRRLFAAADQLWTNTSLRPDQYAQPVLALIALRQMEARFIEVEAELKSTFKGRLKPTPADYQARGATFLPEMARFSRLLALPGNANLGAELNGAMEAIAEGNPDLAGVLPRGYAGLPDKVLAELLRLLAPLKIEGDAYGLVFEYFMGQFAATYMQKGGEFFTPASVVRLIVEVIEPYEGTEDPHHLVGRFDFVMANPPFNQPEVDKARLQNDAGQVDARFPLGLPNADNANYLWIGLFYSALKPTGRAGFVMANSASDAGGSEREMRRKLLQAGAVDCILAVGPNMFFTVTLPVTLWFLDRGKAKGPRADQVLFIDARHLYRQVTRANRTFDPDHIEFLANVVRLWRGEETEEEAGSGPRMAEAFPDGRYRDVPGLCRVATRADIEAQGWSLNPGRYVGTAPGQKIEDEEFKVRLESLHEELDGLNAQATRLQTRIAQNVAELLDT